MGTSVGAQKSRLRFGAFGAHLTAMNSILPMKPEKGLTHTQTWTLSAHAIQLFVCVPHLISPKSMLYIFLMSAPPRAAKRN